MPDNPFLILQKPPFLSPCNRCGECCKAGPCELAMGLLHVAEDEPCTALEIEPGGVFSCGLYKRPMHYVNPQLAGEGDFPQVSELIAAFLGFGAGCGMEDPKESA